MIDDISVQCRHAIFEYNYLARIYKKPDIFMQVKTDRVSITSVYGPGTMGDMRRGEYTGT